MMSQHVSIRSSKRTYRKFIWSIAVAYSRSNFTIKHFSGIVYYRVITYHIAIGTYYLPIIFYLYAQSGFSWIITTDVTCTYIYVICNICYRHILYTYMLVTCNVPCAYIAVNYILIYNDIIQANNNNNNVMTNDDDDDNNNNNNWYFEVKTYTPVMRCQRQRRRRRAAGFFIALQIYSPLLHTHSLTQHLSGRKQKNVDYLRTIIVYAACTAQQLKCQMNIIRHSVEFIIPIITRERSLLLLLVWVLYYIV